MKHVWLITHITFKEAIRNRVLLGIFSLAIALCVANLIFTNMFAYDLGKVAVDVALSIMSITGLIIIFFMGIHLMAKDLDKLTVYMVLSRPIARWEYVIGKFFGLGLMIAVSVAILGVFAWGSVNIVAFNAPNYMPPCFSWLTFGIAMGYALLSLLITMALAVLFTCVTTSPFLAVIMTACSYFIGQNVALIRRMYLQAGDSSGGWLFEKILEVISWIFPNLAAFDLKTTAAYGLPLQTSHVLWTGLYGITYIGLILIIAICVFQHRELT